MGAFLGCSFSDVIGIVSRIGDDKFGRGCFEKSAGLRGVAFLARGEDETDRASSPRTAVDLGAQARLASVRWPDFEPPFCTAGVLVSADIVESMIRYSKSGSSDMASKTRCQNSLTSVAVERRDYLGVSTQGICISQLNSTPLGQQNERL